MTCTTYKEIQEERYLKRQREFERPDQKRWFTLYPNGSVGWK